jgi:PAS domain S-box-containing protein
MTEYAAVILMDNEGKILHWNRTAERMFGYEKEEVIGKEWCRLILPGGLHVHVQSILERVKKTGRGALGGRNIENAAIRSNGAELPVEISILHFRIEGKWHVLCLIRDISGRRKKEEALRESEEKFRALFEEALDAIFVADPETGTIIDCNRAATELTGRTKSELIGKHQRILHPKQEIAEGGLSKTFKQHISEKEGQILETQVITKRGQIKDVAIKANLIELRSKKLLHGIFRDITERKKAEEALKDTSKKMSGLMKSSAMLLHTSDMYERLRTVADAVCEQGWRRAVISLKDENLKTVDIVTAGLTSEEEEYLRRHQPSGEIMRKRLSTMFEQYRLGEFYYLPWSDPLVRDQFKHAIPSKVPKEETVDWNPDDLLYIPLRLPDGQVVGIMSMDDPVDGRRPTKQSLAPLELFAHQAAVAIENARLIKNLNEAKNQLKQYAGRLEEKVDERTKQLKEAQQQLLKAERLAAIGELAAMIGHDLRNPLTGIAGAAYYLRTKNRSRMDARSREMLGVIEKDIAHSNKIINDLLEYSREIHLELTEATARSLVNDALSNVKIPRRIQVRDDARTKPKIKVDTEKMRRVFVNIIRNAIDAMPKGGLLTITSRKADDNVEIVFTDTGIGMSKETLGKVFSPLFTTKAKGMGFGLAIARRFLVSHGGKISVKSTVGKGTTFTVTIPTEPKSKEIEEVWVKLPESLMPKITKA